MTKIKALTRARSFFLLAAYMLALSVSSYASTETINLDLLQKAWLIPTGGSNGKPYYSLEINGVIFSGERDWESRWDLIKDAMDYRDKRILELGCNVALASTYLLKYRDAGISVGVDRTNELLAGFGTPRLIEAASLVQQAFGVHIGIVQLDINGSDYEDILGTDFDVAICMSFLKWTDDKERLLDYLSNFSNVIFEGHDPDPVEIERFQSRGFQYAILGKTQIGVSYPPDATRTIIYFYK